MDGLALATRFWRFAGTDAGHLVGPTRWWLGLRHWVFNAQVPHGYDCDDPARHLAELAAEAGLSGPGVGMLTAVDVRTASTVASRTGSPSTATVGVSQPLWAAGR